MLITNLFLILCAFSFSLVRSASKNQTIVTEYGQALVYHVYIDEETNEPTLGAKWYIASYGDLKNEWTDTQQIRICLEMGRYNDSESIRTQIRWLKKVQDEEFITV